MAGCAKDSGRLQIPAGINQASIGPGRFAAAISTALAWLGISLWLSISWARELGELIGPLAGWLMIIGIALAPGFMNAFQTASLLLRPRSRHLPQTEFPPLTILIAAYNEAADIARTLRSIDAQRYRGELDVILIDDGSTDGTAGKALEAGYPWLRLLVQPRNTGKAAALNRGLAEARCELIVTLDADSWLHPDALRLLVQEYLSGQPQTAAVAGAVFINNDRASWVTRLQQWDYFHGIAATKRAQAAYGGTLVAQGAFSLYRREILREIGGWPQCVGEDIVVTWAILRRGLIVGYAEDALCFTRVPETLGGLVRQRARWGRGMIEALRAHPRILVRPRLTTFLVSWNLMFPWIDFAFTFGFIPGLVLALFGKYWLVGPVTLALVPSAVFMGTVMYRMSARVFSERGMAISRDYSALLWYTLGYGLILHPASLRGYAAELLGLRKSWGTK
jgi:biofilm PGA synthesis N-glycosyltransferase PgaC